MNFYKKCIIHKIKTHLSVTWWLSLLPKKWNKAMPSFLCKKLYIFCSSSDIPSVANVASISQLFLLNVKKRMKPIKKKVPCFFFKLVQKFQKYYNFSTVELRFSFLACLNFLATLLPFLAHCSFSLNLS